MAIASWQSERLFGIIGGNNILDSAHGDAPGYLRARYRNLLDLMKALNVGVHMNLMALFEKLDQIQEQVSDSVVLTEDVRESLKEFDSPGGLATGLPATIASLTKIAALSQNPKATVGELRGLFQEFRGRFVDEMANRVVFAIEDEDRDLIGNRPLFGEQVAEAFPSAITDIEEAGKCLAFERNTACVFHLMRVMEVGLKALGDRLEIAKTHKPGWETILKKAHGQMSLPNDKKQPEWIKDEAFLADAIAMLTAVKTAWRNTTMHIEQTYTSEQARDIFGAVRGFMKHLAAKLHE